MHKETLFHLEERFTFIHSLKPSHVRIDHPIQISPEGSRWKKSVNSQIRLQ
ncbi:hypothetical protein [Jeotgalibacillus sp. R-1-5s-1]|uniref:hypothetical protein n=1 Tax=Jeotgalibacillus sp. R-1-5s-1 TaxID=2555897 RepID=UPI00141A75D9|nr:hypothetical protein [Jeotgalibacillus sp. R-1-5s-1]